MKALIFVNLIFAIGLGFFIGLPVENNWLWLGFITLWCVVEAFLARDTSLKWWHWALLLSVLGVLDLVIIKLLG